MPGGVGGHCRRMGFCIIISDFYFTSTNREYRLKEAFAISWLTHPLTGLDLREGPFSVIFKTINRFPTNKRPSISIPFNPSQRPCLDAPSPEVSCIVTSQVFGRKRSLIDKVEGFPYQRDILINGTANTMRA